MYNNNTATQKERGHTKKPQKYVCEVRKKLKDDGANLTSDSSSDTIYDMSGSGTFFLWHCNQSYVA